MSWFVSSIKVYSLVIVVACLKFVLKHYRNILNILQRVKKVMSDSPGLVDFAIGLVNSLFNLPDV